MSAAARSRVDLGFEVPAPEQLGRVHFIGIGGAGMSGLARIMLARGVPVSGSDAKDSPLLAALRAEGAEVHVGHDAAVVERVDTVVASSAIRPSNPELAAAQQRGLLVLHRSQALKSVMHDHRVVAVAGANGKTTTTSMLTVALQHCGADPSFAIGGELSEIGTNAHQGSGGLFVAEADESDGSFLVYHPEIAVVTNVQPDHLDFYGTVESVEEAYAEFAATLPADGLLVACADDPGSARLAARVRAEGGSVTTYGESDDADVRVDGLVMDRGLARFGLVEHGRRVGDITLRVPGRHNALNAAAAYVAATAAGHPGGLVREGLAGFGGTRRRFEARGEASGVRVFDDYAHNPGKVAAAVATGREVAGEGRLVVVFQPHLFSRTRDFATELGAALGPADEVVVMDVYAAREDPEPGVSGALVADAVPLGPEHVRFVPSWQEVPDVVAGLAGAGDLVLTVGAGDVTLVGPEVLARLAGVGGP